MEFIKVITLDQANKERDNNVTCSLSDGYYDISDYRGYMLVKRVSFGEMKICNINILYDGKCDACGKSIECEKDLDFNYCDKICEDAYKKTESRKQADVILEKRKSNRLKYPVDFASFCGVKKRHLNCDLQNYIGDISFVSEWEKDKTQNILIHSQNAGSGKTHLAVALLKYIGGNFPIDYRVSDRFSPLPKTGADFLFQSSSQLMVDIRNTFNDNDKTDADIINRLSSVPRLIIDDIGAEKVSDYVVSVIYLILNNRYENTLPTIITTNLTAEAMASFYNQRIVSRAVSGIVVKLKGDDMRIKDSKKF